MASAPPGTRNTTLFRLVAGLSAYVADGALNPTEVRRALREAAIAAGLGSGEADVAIGSGIDRDSADKAWYPSSAGAGEWNRPRVVQWRGRVYRLTASERPSQVIEGWAAGAIPTSHAEADRLWVTTYPSDRITQGIGEWWTWAELEDAVREPLPWPEEGKRGLPLWSPTKVEGNDRGRRADGLDSSGQERHRQCQTDGTWALVLDYDDEPAWSLEQVREWWSAVRYVAHTTSSHLAPKGEKPAHARGRVVIALSRPVSEEEHEALAAWALACGRGRIGEAELRNVRRGYYAPAVAPGGYLSDAHLVDTVLDVDAVLGATAQIETESSDLSVDSETWAVLDLRTPKEGEPTPRDHNVNIMRILETDPRWRGRIHRNDFSGQVEVDGRPVRDEVETACGVWLGEVYQIHPPTTRIHEVLALVADRSAYHPVRDYLSGLKWDGVPRLHTFLHECFGCVADDTSAAVGTRWTIAAVARIMEPGCKVDEMLILKGEQGAGKSRALQALCPDPAWFSDTALPIGEKDAFQQLSGVWIYELGEMASVRGREWEHVKAFLSSQVDRYRASYGRNIVRVPRQNVFCGSTNEAAFLGDSTGQRRFWVREIGRCSPERVAELRDQIWAEAVHLYRAGEQWHMTAAEAAAASVAAERYRQVDPWEDPIREYCVGRAAVSVREILEHVLEKPVDARTRGDEQRVVAVLAVDRVREHTKTGNVWRLKVNPPSPLVNPPSPRKDRDNGTYS
jgi:predicted P-loop ATPase